MQNLVTIKPTNFYGKTLSIALILILTLSSAMAILPTIKAQTQNYSYTITRGTNGLINAPTFAGLTVSPNPDGVGQAINIIMEIELLPPSMGQEAVTGTTGGWLGFMLTITDPNGKTTSLGPYESDVSGTYQVTYTPTTVGTYSFTFNYPGQTNKGTGYGGYYANFLASTASATATVTQTQLTAYQEAPVPLPTQYWTLPINGQNRAWNVVSGPWLMGSSTYGGGYNSTGSFNPYTYAPQSAHVLWSQSSLPNQYGLIGGVYGSLPFGGTSGVTGTGYPEEGFGSRTSMIIIAGYVYYDSSAAVVQGSTQGNSALTNTAYNTITCMNIQTGTTVWTVPGQFNYGQIVDWRSQQQRMALPYLWDITSGMYQMYDAINGQLLAQWNNLAAGTVVHYPGVNDTIGKTYALPSAVTVYSGTVFNEPPSTTVIGQDIGGAGGGGALLVYFTGRNANQNSSWLACWNSTQALCSYAGDPVVWPFMSSGVSEPITNSYYPSIALTTSTNPVPWSYGIMWNYTLPPFYTINAAGQTVAASPSIFGVDGNYVCMYTSKSNTNNTLTDEYFDMAAFPMASTHIGAFGLPLAAAWTTTVNVPQYDQSYDQLAFPGWATLRSGGNIIVTDATLLTVWCYSETTGQLVWTCQPYQNDFSLQMTAPGVVAYGMLYQPGYDGYEHAINMTTGVQQWVSITRAGGLEMPEPAYPAVGSIAAGPTINMGEVFTTTTKAYETQPAYRGHCLYAYNALTGAQNWNISGEFAYQSIEVADGIMLAFNTYDGREYAFGMGQTATTVTAPMTSITAGSNVVIQGTVTDQTPGITKGTPAISDTWMTPWMQYLYMDQPYPTQATGVTVQIAAIDPNNNFITIGNATSDITGSYHYTWTPPNIPGTYTIIATFNADNSYYGSSAETSTVIAPPTSATAAPIASPTSVADTYFMPATAGIIVVMIIGFIVLALLMLRKKP